MELLVHAGQHIWSFVSGGYTAHGIIIVHVIMATPTPHLLLWAMTIFVRVLLQVHIMEMVMTDNVNATYYKNSPPFVGNDYFCENIRSVSNWNVN